MSCCSHGSGNGGKGFLLVFLAFFSLFLAGNEARSQADAIADLSAKLVRRPRVSGADGRFRGLTAECLIQGAHMRGLETLGQVMVSVMGDDKDSRLEERNLLSLSAAADAGVMLLQCRDFAPGATFRRDVTEWLLSHDDRLHLFLETLGPLDNWPAALDIVHTLHDHDPDGRDAFFALILALAVVWDQQRPAPHPQMGVNPLPFTPDITRRYDDFKQLFNSRQAQIQYRRLSVTALTYVVDLPIPLEEIAWIRENIRPRNWNRKFFEIEYDDARLQREAYQWPHGPYRMEAIETKGGICTDQAYYATMAARAFGIPALLFVGEGRRGPHAWYGYMKGTERWELDIGRFAYDKYATGHAIDPQTNRFMTDHDVTFACDRALRQDRFRDAARLGRLGAILHGLGYRRAAREAAQRSLAVSPLYDLAWNLVERLEREDGNLKGLVALLDNKAGVFRDYPDYLATIRRQQADALRQLGDHAGAERLLRRQQDRLKSERDDLARALTSDRVAAAYEQGDYRAARERFETLLRDQKNEGQKVLPMLDQYLELTRQTQQTSEAVRFVKRYINSLGQRYGNTSQNQAVLQQFLLKAYLNDGDERNADRVRRKLERLQ